VGKSLDCQYGLDLLLLKPVGGIRKLAFLRLLLSISWPWNMEAANIHEVFIIRPTHNAVLAYWN